MPPPPASPVSAEGARLSRPSPAIPASSKVPGPRSAPTRSTELGQSHPSPSEPSLSQSLLATRQMESARMYLPQRAVPAPVVPCDRRNSPESYDPTGHVTSHMSGVDQYTSYPSPLGGRPRSAPRICSATGVSSPNQDAARHRHSADVPVHRQPHRRPEELIIDQSRQVTIVTRNAEFTRSPQHFDPRSAEVHPSGPSYRSILPPATLPHYQSHHHRPEEPLRHDPRNDADQTWYAAEYSRSPQPYMSRDEQINLEFSEHRSASVAEFPQRPVTRSATRTRPVSNLADPRRMDSSSDARRTTQLIGQDQRPNGHVTYVQPANEPLFYEGQPELRVTSRPTQLQLETSQAALIAETVDAVLRKLQATPLSSPHATDTSRSVPMAPPAAGRVPSPRTFPSASTFSLGLGAGDNRLPSTDSDSQGAGIRIIQQGGGIEHTTGIREDKDTFQASGSLLTQLCLHSEGDYSFSQIVKMLMISETVKIDPKTKHFANVQSLERPTYDGHSPPFPAFVDQFENKRRQTQWSDWEATGALIAILRGEAKDMFDAWAHAMTDAGTPLAERHYKAILRALAMRYWNRDARAAAKTTFLQLSQADDETWLQYMARYNQFRQGLTLTPSEEKTPLYALKSIALTSMVANSTLPVRLLIGELTDQDARYNARKGQEAPPKQTVTFLNPSSVARVFSSAPPNDRLTNASSFAPVRGVDKERLSRDQEAAKSDNFRRPFKRNSYDSVNRGPQQQSLYDWSKHKCEFCEVVGHGIRRCRAFSSFLREQAAAPTKNSILSEAFRTHSGHTKTTTLEVSEPRTNAYEHPKK
jgi:hypothetical protein